MGAAEKNGVNTASSKTPSLTRQDVALICDFTNTLITLADAVRYDWLPLIFVPSYSTTIIGDGIMPRLVCICLGMVCLRTALDLSH
ncbi:MAG: hypothetical protein P8Y67_10395 [Alphaproteobacteria bacterium]